MAISANTVFEVQTGGSDTNSGGFVAGSSGTDWSQQTSPQYSVTDGVTAGTTTITSVTAAFGTDVVGNLIYVAGGTGSITAGWYQILTRTNSTTITVDRSTGLSVGTGATLHIGGALATPGQALALYVAGNTIWCKGSSTISSTTANISGGRLNFNVTGSQPAFNRFYGYGTTRGDNGRYVLTLGSGLNATVLTTNNANSYNDIRNIEISGNSTSGAAAVVHNGRSNRIRNIKASGFSGGGANIVSVASNSALCDFEISGGATANFAALEIDPYGIITDGWVHGNAGRGINAGSGGGGPTADRVASTDHTGSNGYGWMFGEAGEFYLRGCISWNNAQTNYFLANANPALICVDCISGASGGYDWDNRSCPDAVVLINCAAKTSTSGQFPSTPSIAINLKTLTADPFSNRTSGDFSLNSTASAGAFCRGVSRAIMLGQTTTYSDIGAAQHQDAGSGVSRSRTQ